MACAYRDPRTGGWIADFRGVHAPGRKRRHVRIPRDRADDKARAIAYAIECDRYARILEAVPATADIDHAAHLGVVTKEQAQALREGLALPPNGRASDHDPLRPWTLQAAAEAHPTVRREKANRPPDYRKHCKYLAAFAAWSGSQLLVDLTLDQVSRWVDHLRAEGYQWDTRRHALLYLRHAARMAAAVAHMPDVIGGIALDRNDKRGDVAVWSLGEMVRAAATLAVSRLQLERRGAVVIALGGFLGLRPTEKLRLRVRHIAGDILRVGVDESKNISSRRDLPIPASVLPWITEACIDHATGRRRPDDDWLIPGRRGHALSPHALDAWWKDYIGPHLPCALSPKHLRKSFATWTAEAGIEPRYFEAYLGHQSSQVATVTSRHYLAAARVHTLRPAAEILDQHLAPAVEAARAHRPPPPSRRRRARHPPARVPTPSSHTGT